MAHKYHYDSPRQASAWLALHEAYSPARRDPRCRETYERAFEDVFEWCHSQALHLVGLGCGGGQKDLALLWRGIRAGRRMRYTPVDTSLPLVLTAWAACRAADVMEPSGPDGEDGWICDLGQAQDLGHALSPAALPGECRLLSYFGMMPNFEPDQVLPWLADWAGPGGRILLSANLAPGQDYRQGMDEVRHLYENDLTNRWLQSLLWDVGLEPASGRVEWSVEEHPPGSGLLRFRADYVLEQPGVTELPGWRRTWQPGERCRLFFSYRHTPARLATQAAAAGLTLLQQWISPAEDEGVFLFRPADGQGAAS